MGRLLRGLLLAALLLLVIVLLTVPAAAQEGLLERLQEEVRGIARRAGPAVVSVRAERRIDLGFSPAGGEEEMPVLAPGIRNIEAMVGTGFLVSSEGHVVTTYRTVAGADAVRVTLGDGGERPAEVRGGDAFFQIAVLEIGPVEGVQPLEIKGGEDAVPGTIGLFLGRSFGEIPNLDLAIVSGRGQAVEELGYDNYLVTGATVRPGEAGAPLLDAEGRVLGMGVGTFSGGAVRLDRRGGVTFRGVPGSAGIGLMVPASDLRFAVEEILRHGRVRDGRLGIRLDFDSLEIQHVIPGSPAARMGLARGDVLRTLDGRPIPSFDRFRFLMRRHPVGRLLSVEVLREGGPFSGTCRMEERPATLRSLLPRLGESSDGVVVVSVSTLQHELGFREGDVLIAANDLPVPDLHELMKAVFGPGGTDAVSLRIRRDDREIELVIER